MKGQNLLMGGAAIVEMIINVLSFGLGIIGLVWAWRAFRMQANKTAPSMHG